MNNARNDSHHVSHHSCQTKRRQDNHNPTTQEPITSSVWSGRKRQREIEFSIYRTITIAFAPYCSKTIIQGKNSGYCTTNSVRIFVINFQPIIIELTMMSRHHNNALFLLGALILPSSILGQGSSVVEFSSGDFQEVCEAIELEIPTDSVATPDMCDCKQIDDTTVDLSCDIDNACLSSDGQKAMQGDYSVLLRNEGVNQETTYAQTIQITSCFDYPDDMYDGEKVCFETIQDGLSVNSQCTITVGDDPNNKCLYCRFCAGRKLTFNCTNIGYEDRSSCVDDNVDGTLLQFLHEAEIVDTCPKLKSGSSGGNGSSFAMALSVRSVAYMIVTSAVLYTTWIL